MSGVHWTETPLGRMHERAGFDCGHKDLNDYLFRFARQNHESGGAKCFVAASVDEPGKILGFYTLSPASLAFSRVPKQIAKRLGRYDVPVFRLGRLAVDVSMQGRGLGGALLLRAGARCLRIVPDVGGVALLIDAKDDRAAAWYGRFGALPLPDQPLSLLLPLATVEAALKAGEPA